MNRESVMVARFVVDVFDVGDRWWADGEWATVEAVDEVEMLEVGARLLRDLAAEVEEDLRGSRSRHPAGRRGRRGHLRLVRPCVDGAPGGVPPGPTTGRAAG